jgi:predicted phosphate transport protein (TIGR00153 family)
MQEAIMRIPFVSIFITSPFDGLLEHAEKVKECAWAFQQAIECYATEQCKVFEEYRQEVTKLESEADAIKRRIRGHIPVGTRMPVSKFQLFLYLKEQDKVLDSVEEALDWISYRVDPRFPESLKKDLFLLVDAVIDPIEELSRMVAEAKRYFESYSEKQRNIVKDIIHNLRQREHEADRLEDGLKLKIFSMEKDPVGIFHMVKLTEIIGSVADHAENAGDMMRSMIARKRGIFKGEK